MSGGVTARRWLTVLCAALAAAVLLVVAVPSGPARAASSPCAGRKVHTFGFSTGAVKLYRSGAYLCALTVPEHPGHRRTMTVSLQVRGFEPVVDKGRFTRYAGPVRAYVGHRTVRVRGSVGGGSYNSRAWKRY